MIIVKSITKLIVVYAYSLWIREWSFKLSGCVKFLVFVCACLQGVREFWILNLLVLSCVDVITFGLPWRIQELLTVWWFGRGSNFGRVFVGVWNRQNGDACRGCRSRRTCTDNWRSHCNWGNLVCCNQATR